MQTDPIKPREAGPLNKRPRAHDDTSSSYVLYGADEMQHGVNEIKTMSRAWPKTIDASLVLLTELFEMANVPDGVVEAMQERVNEAEKACDCGCPGCQLCVPGLSPWCKTAEPNEHYFGLCQGCPGCRGLDSKEMRAVTVRRSVVRCIRVGKDKPDEWVISSSDTLAIDGGVVSGNESNNSLQEHRNEDAMKKSLTEEANNWTWVCHGDRNRKNLHCENQMPIGGWATRCMLYKMGAHQCWIAHPVDLEMKRRYWARMTTVSELQEGDFDDNDHCRCCGEKMHLDFPLAKAAMDSTMSTPVSEKVLNYMCCPYAQERLLVQEYL